MDQVHNTYTLSHPDAPTDLFVLSVHYDTKRYELRLTSVKSGSYAVVETGAFVRYHRFCDIMGDAASRYGALGFNVIETGA